MKTCIILNPNSGSYDDVHLLVDRMGAEQDVEIRETLEAGDARRLASESVSAGCERIVVGGGDGTLNEVLNGLAPNFAGVRLALFPLGTGNDFARSIYTTDNKEDIIGIIREDHHVPIDVVRMCGPEGDHYFLNASGGGFSAELSRHLADSDMKKWLGSFSYVVSGAATLAAAEASTALVTFDEEEEHGLELYNVVVSNGRFIGGGVQAAPKAFLNDGLMNVLVVPDLPLPRLAALLPQIPSGTYGDNEDVVVRLARRLAIRTEKPTLFNADGELLPPGNYDFKVVPMALNFVVDRLSEAIAR